MQTFEEKLIKNVVRWRDNDFIEQQMYSHFDEIKELIINGDEHKYKECIDLINILAAYLKNNKSNSEIEDIIKKREAKFINKSKPKKEWRISITENCNYRCFFCHEEGLDMEKDRKDRSFDEIYNVVKKGIELGYEDITFTGGEPLIKKRIIEEILIKLNQENLNPDITIVTNAYLIDDQLLDVIEKYNGYLKFNISTHSVNKEMYNKITNPKSNQSVDAFEKLIENIDKIKRKNIPIKLNFVLLKGMNTSKEYTDKIIEFALEHNVDYIKFSELLVTEKLKKYYNFYYDVFSLENYYKKEFRLIDSIERRKVYQYKETDLKIELQMCTCKVGCNKCILVRDKTVTSELEYFPCFILNTKGIDVSNPDDLEAAFNKGDGLISEMAKQYKNGSPIIISNPVYYKEKKDYFYKTSIDNLEELREILEKNNLTLNRKTSLKEIYFMPKNPSEKWMNYEKSLKLISIGYKGFEWKELLQESRYVNEDEFHVISKFLSGTKPKIIESFKEYKNHMKELEFELSSTVSWEIEFYSDEEEEISISKNCDNNDIIIRSDYSMEKSNLKKDLILENINMPLREYFKLNENSGF